MANWSLKVNVNGLAIDVLRQGRGGEVDRRERREGQRNRRRLPCRQLTVIPGVLLLLLTALPVLSHIPQATSPLCAEDRDSGTAAPLRPGASVCPFGIES